MSTTSTMSSDLLLSSVDGIVPRRHDSTSRLTPRSSPTSSLQRSCPHKRLLAMLRNFMPAFDVKVMSLGVLDSVNFPAVRSFHTLLAVFGSAGPYACGPCWDSICVAIASAVLTSFSVMQRNVKTAEAIATQ